VARLLRVIAGHHIGAESLQRVQHREGRRIEYDCFPAALAVRQEQTAALNIDMLPTQMQDFAQAAAGKQQ
jgi:hypothetical protein